MQGVPEPVSSNNREYQIYALIDPRDNFVHYVGISVNEQTREAGEAQVAPINLCLGLAQEEQRIRRQR